MDNKQEIIEALKNLNEAFYNLVSAWYQDDADVLNNSNSISIYPFEKSFDEMAIEVSDWAKATINELNNKEL